MPGLRAVGWAEPEPKTHKAATAQPPIPPRHAEDPGGRAWRGRSREGGNKSLTISCGSGHLTQRPQHFAAVALFFVSEIKYDCEPGTRVTQ